MIHTKLVKLTKKLLFFYILLIGVTKMAISFHLKCITLSLLLFAKALLSEQVVDSERKNTIPNLNDPELRLFLTKSLARHPLGLLLGHVLIQAVDKASSNLQGKRSSIFVLQKHYLLIIISNPSFINYISQCNQIPY